MAAVPVLGMAADAIVADPRRGHPVALFGALATRTEGWLWRDSRLAGAGYAAGLLSAAGGLGVALHAGTRRRPALRALAGVLATWTVVGAASLHREAHRQAALVAAGDLAGARAHLPALCGRDPAALDLSGVTAATVESVAENTADAVVGPLLWGAVAGLPGLLAYRAANTLDAMVGHRTRRYRRFGWAAARVDDALGWLPARLTAVLAVLFAPLAGGSPAGALRAWRRDAGRHPSPNAGRCEAAFAGALGVRLGGRTVYAEGAEDRPVLGTGRAPQVGDIGRAVTLSRAIGVATAGLAGLLAAVAHGSGGSR